MPGSRRSRWVGSSLCSLCSCSDSSLLCHGALCASLLAGLDMLLFFMCIYAFKS